MPRPTSPRIQQFVLDLDSVRVHRSPNGTQSLKKPLLLLLVLKKIRSGTLRENSILFADIEAELATWIRNFGAVGSNSPGPAEPFYHLRSSPFWRIDGCEMGPNAHCKPFSASALKASKVAAHLDDDLFAELAAHSEGCSAAIEAVLRKWWPGGAPDSLKQALQS